MAFAARPPGKMCDAYMLITALIFIRRYELRQISLRELDARSCREAHDLSVLRNKALFHLPRHARSESRR